MADDLLPDVEAFLLLHGMAARAFGAEALNDSAFVEQLRAGREPRRATVNRVRLFMEKKARQLDAPSSGGLFPEEPAPAAPVKKRGRPVGSVNKPVQHPPISHGSGSGKPATKEGKPPPRRGKPR